MVDLYIYQLSCVTIYTIDLFPGKKKLLVVGEQKKIRKQN